jgi:hypothetical protein
VAVFWGFPKFEGQGFDAGNNARMALPPGEARPAVTKQTIVNSPNSSLKRTLPAELFSALRFGISVELYTELHYYTSSRIELIGFSEHQKYRLIIKFQIEYLHI